MAVQKLVTITGAVEGDLDEAVIRRLIFHVGATAGPIHGRNGKAQLRQRVTGYNRAARLSPWVVLVDLDNEESCAPTLVSKWLSDPAPNMCFRVAVRMVESWLLADRDRLAQFLAVPKGRLPANPDSIDNPKQTIVGLAGGSRRRDIRVDMIPRPGSGRSVGPAYTSRLIEFVAGPTAIWQPDAASKASDSLNGCLQRLRRFVQI
jgi:hypothetical protein